MDVVQHRDSPGSIELLQPAEGSAPGDRVFVEGHSDHEMSAVPDLLNPKKKIWDKLQVIIMVYYAVLHRDVMQPSKIRIRQMQISCAKSVRCGFVVRSQLPAIMATAVQLSYLK